MSYLDTLKKIEDEMYQSGKSSLYDTEYKRASDVLNQRRSAGQDVSAQEKYIQQLKEKVAAGQARRSAYSAGVDPNNVDPRYISALASGNTQDYYKDLNSVSQTAPPGSNLPAVQQPGVPGFADRSYIPEQDRGTQERGMRYKVPQYKRPSYETLINDRFNSQRESFLAKLRASKASALGDYANQEAYARQAGRQALSANDVERAKAMQNMFAGLEATGQYGGGENIRGRSSIDTVASQNANLINRDVANQLMDIQSQKGLIERTAAENELAMLQDLSAEESRALLEAAQYGDTMDFQNRQFEYGVSKDAQDRLDRLAELTGVVNGQSTLAKQSLDASNQQWKTQFDANQAWKQWETQFQEQEALWQKSADNPAYQAQVLANQAQILTNQLAELQINDYPKEQKLKLEQWRKEIAQIGVSKPMTQYDIDLAKAQINKIKAEADRITAETNAIDNPQLDQKQVSDYWISSAMAELKKLPDYQSRKAWLDKYSSWIIKQAGTEAYNFLQGQLLY